MADAERLERDAAALQIDVGSLETEHDRLQSSIAAVVDDAQVEAWARREAKMVRPSERLIIPVPVEGNSEPIRPAVESAPPLPSPWDVWWALLIGR
jgi:hypothetical protein